jgi:hypothetical protein
MLHRMLPACLLAAALVAANGCCCSQPFIAHGSSVAESCANGDCGECASCGVHNHPVWQGTQRALTCGSGCGEMYWGDWLSYPPTCNGCDSWACESCCSPWHVLSGLRNLWGYRYRPGGCGRSDCDGSCDSCSAGYSEGLPSESVPERAGERLVPPSPSPEPAPERKATETTYRFRQATYAKPAPKHAPRPTKTRPARQLKAVDDGTPQPEQRVSRDITR